MVESTRLEYVRPSKDPGFESLSHRIILKIMQRPQLYQTTIDSLDYSSNRQVVFLRMKIQGQDFHFQEGQFVMMHLNTAGKTVKRSYSICTTYSEYLQHRTIGFLIKYVPDGLASNYFFQDAHEGDTIDIIWGLGHMILPEQPWNNHFILISTGSGLSPIYWIFKRLLELNQYKSIIHLYGEKSQERLISETVPLLTMSSDSVVSNVCLSRQPEASLANHYHGYVWHCLEDMVQHGKLAIQGDETHKVYICGKPEMVEGMIKQLTWYGIPKENISFEKY